MVSYYYVHIFRKHFISPHNVSFQTIELSQLQLRLFRFQAKKFERFSLLCHFCPSISFPVIITREEEKYELLASLAKQKILTVQTGREGSPGHAIVYIIPWHFSDVRESVGSMLPARDSVKVKKEEEVLSNLEMGGERKTRDDERRDYRLIVSCSSFISVEFLTGVFSARIFDQSHVYVTTERERERERSF